MTDEALKGLAAQALNMAKRDIEQDRDFNFLLASYHESDVPPIHRMTKIEEFIVGRLGQNWLNSARTKDAGFSVLRKAVSMLPPDAVVFVLSANGFALTPKFYELAVAQQEELFNAGHDRHHQAVKEGLMEVHDALLAYVQTPQRVCQYLQIRDERGQFVGQPEVHIGPQDQFEGRLKMY